MNNARKLGYFEVYYKQPTCAQNLENSRYNMVYKCPNLLKNKKY